MNRSADYRTTEDKLYDIFMAESTSEGEKFNAGALYFKRTGKLIQMHMRTPDPVVVAAEAAQARRSGFEEVVREWERQAAATRARHDDPYAYGASDYNDPDRVAERERARKAAAARARATAAAGARRRSTYRSRWADSSSRDYSARGWSRSGLGWVDADGRYHDASGRYAKRPRP